MHNGCLLLLAFVAVFQPIASYTERGLVDGSQQRCDYRTSVRDPGLNLHGTYRFAKPAVEDRRLNQRQRIRDIRRNEVREDSLRTASPSGRGLADPLESNRDVRDSLKVSSRGRIGNDAVLRREVREARLSSYRDERNQEIRRERVARVQETHPGRSPSHREQSRSEYENRYQRTDNRLSNERRESGVPSRDTRTNDAGTQRVGENREIRAAMNRVRDDVAGRLNERRLKERVQRMETLRSASRIHLNGNTDTDRDILGRRYSNIERVNRAYNGEDSRMASRDETTSIDRDHRHMSSSRQSGDEQRQLRDVSRIRFETERRNIPESASRMNVRDLHERASEIQREARLFERAPSTESRRENRDIESRQIRTVRSVDGRVSQDDESNSRRFARERSAENRRDVGDDRSMDRFRKDSRSSDRARVLESRREVRNIETRRDIRNIERDSSEIRGETRNRDTCAYDRERSAEHRMTRLARERSHENQRVARNVEFRGISTKRVDENRQEYDHRSFRTERTDESRRDICNLESRAFRTERIEQTRRDSSNVVSRLFRTERSAIETRRAAPIVGVRSFRTEHNSRQNGFRAVTVRVTDSRRNTQDFEMLYRSLDRDINYRRESRSLHHERGVENRRNIRDTESRTEYERDANRRVARSLERESRTNGRGRTMESRLNERMVARRSDDPRERATENSRNAQNNPKELRTLDSHEGRRVGSRGINLVRSRDDLTQRRTESAIERLSKRDSLENRYRYTLQRETQRDIQRTTERDNLASRLREDEVRNGVNADFARKREFQAMFKNPTHAENKTPNMNWQYIFYTVQALYIGGLLMQLNKRSTDKKTRVSWWSAPQHLIKVE